MKEIIMEEKQCKSVFTLNTWTEEKKAEVRELLAKGLWVHLGSSALGHTMSRMVENDGINWVKSEYGDKVEIAIREGWGWKYCRLIP